MTFNTKDLIDNSPLSRLQYATLMVCFFMNMLDGMDVLVISYAAPAISEAWGISPQALGVVFGSGLFGMTFGALFLAPIADRIGRKNMILLSAALMGTTVYITSFATSIYWLVVLRFISGLGIGSMLASTAALAAEYTPHKTKDFWVSFVISGYPVGAVLSGLTSGKIIVEEGWQTMFQVAGAITIVSLPIIYFFLTESLDFYIKKQPKRALEKINLILAEMGFETIGVVPPKASEQHKTSVQSLLGNEFRTPTFQLWIALFFAFATLYFLTSWIPKLATNAGLSMQLAIYTGTVFNVGAWFGIMTQGYFSSRYGLKKTIGIILILTGVLMAIFKIFIGSDAILYVFGLLGFGIQGGFVGLYAVSARMYPTEFRTTGVGWAIGIGRTGGIFGPAVGGVLIGMGLSLSANFLIYAVPTVLAGVMTLFISSKEVS
ncbi:MFS transporter [Emticicia sp. BO119]|uniref:MFS transporter n=1 Tax=Emticicia sp. BO119 TaxID=2757768 RepID=UPI0015F0F9FA|nr:MFS transporter [Emticicia sp. BO119]MBA4850262.1 MFS transporter [Emticicia sp. BO119]